MSLKDKLPTRIPDYLQGDNELREYLESAGELFDEMKQTIEAMDSYDDYQNAPESRLSKLAYEFGMNFPRNLNVELQRAIIRDLEDIYQKTGTVDVVNWIFRLIGWDVTLESAWVLNPERYDPRIRDVHDMDDYDGVKTEEILTDFYRNDYRNFLIGEEYVMSNGTYFKGRRFFDLDDTFLKNEIVGEAYRKQDKTRTPDKVMKTPYLFIRVSEETYNIFIAPYVDEDTGETYEYTELEFFRVVENIFNFFLFDAFRPTNVRVVIVVTAQILQDDMTASETIDEDWVAEPLDKDDEMVAYDDEDSKLHHVIRAGVNFIAGAPPSPFNKDMVLSAIRRANLRTQDDTQTYVDGSGEKYVIEERADRPVARCGTNRFEFTTPHEDTFQFRRVFISEVSSANLVGGGGIEAAAPYEGEDPALTLNFDLMSDTYGIVEALSNQGIVIRNPTSVASPNFSPATAPVDEYLVGSLKTDGSGDYEQNNLFGFDTRDSLNAEVDDTSKTFTYDYDADVYVKTNNLQDNWEFLQSMPKDGDLQGLTKYNTIILSFNVPIPYDFVIDIDYEAQEHWENRNAS